MIARIHMTQDETLTIDGRRYVNKEGWKPSGLWYGIGDAWARWCAENMPSWIDGAVAYALDVEASRVLRISSADDVVHAMELYGRVSWRGAGLDLMAWDAVASRYAGIEIDPYDSIAHSATWWYAWDCASGCIWDVSVIRSCARIQIADLRLGKAGRP